MATDKKNVTNNNDAYVDNIKNYANQITSIDSIIEAIRKLPGMYIGSIGTSGWMTCLREIFQNAVDEAIKEDSPCNYIKVFYSEKDCSCIIEDNGRGIPHGQILKVYNTEHSSSNYNKKPGEYSSGVHGIGAVCAVAFSSIFTVDSYVLGKAKHVEFIEGYPWDKKPVEQDIACPKNRQGTTVYLKPSLDALGPVELTAAELFDMVIKILPLTNIGTKLSFKATDKKGKVIIDENLVNKDGIMTGLYNKCKTPVIAPIYYKADNGTTKCEICLTWDSSDLSNSEDITSFSNFTCTMGGTHVQGFTDGVTLFFRDYMNNIYLSNNKKLTIINSDVKTALKAVVVAAHIDPIFIGQSKAILSNKDMADFIKNTTIKALNDWSKRNSNDLQKICKFIKDIAEVRSKEDNEKVKLSSKYQANLLTGKPKKYLPPSGNKNLELVIVEGDSALGSTKNSRDYTCQGIYPIRGKLPNAFNTSRSSFLSNEEVASIITIIGGGYGKNFNLSKVKWDKIIFMADADPDGAHIRTLLLRFFLMYMPELIQDGRVYGSLPPLYGLRVGKAMKYFTNKIDFTKYIQGIFIKSHTITTLTNDKMSNVEISGFFVKNIDYIYMMDYISNTFAINTGLLEAVLYRIAPYIKFIDKRKKTVIYNDIINNFSNNISAGTNDNTFPIINSSANAEYKYTVSDKFNFNTFKKSIEQLFRFIKVFRNKDGCITIEGLESGKYHYILLNNRFVSACSDIIELINNNRALFYKVDGEQQSIYGVMTMFNSCVPSSLTRYKGLGEQDPKQLGESALRPDSVRTLVRYTIEDVKNDIELIRYIDSNRAMLLKGVNITRQDIE